MLAPADHGYSYTDSGAMGSFAVFYLAGLYPLPATEQFLLSSPSFRQISFINPVFKTTTVIKANNFAGGTGSGAGGQVYVQVCFFNFSADAKRRSHSDDRV